MKVRVICAPRLTASSVFTTDHTFAPLEENIWEALLSSATPFLETQRAVLNETGQQPTHFLVGWKTMAEMRIVDAIARIVVICDGVPTFDGIPMYLDPTVEHSVVAVPEFDYVVGRPMPAKACWRP